MQQELAPPFFHASLKPFGAEEILCHARAAAEALTAADAHEARLRHQAAQRRGAGVEPSHATNALRPLVHLLRHRRVLELDAGRGQRSELLAGVAKELTAVCSSVDEARLLRRRLAGEQAPHVVAADLLELPATARFDVVVAANSLDHASPARADAWLAHVRRLLVPDGLLLLGQSNALSPRQLADHVARTAPFAGPRWGRRALAARLSAAGLMGQRTWAVFPSLTAAQVVLSQEGAHAGTDELRPLLAELRQEAGSTRAPLGAQANVWPEVAKNGLLLELAPALWVAARARPFAADDDVVADADDLAYGYATHRPRQLHKESILKTTQGRLEVVRRRLHPELRPAHNGVVQRLDDEAVPPGDTVEQRLHVALETPGWSAASAAQALMPWAQLVGRHQHYRGTVAGHFVDVGPSNVAVTSSGQAEAFALEWDVGEDVPVSWVLYRGIKRALLRHVGVARPAAGQSLQVQSLLQEILLALGVGLDAGALAALEAREQATFGWLAPSATATLRVEP